MAWLLLMAWQLFFYFDAFAEEPMTPLPFHLLGVSVSLLSAPVLFLYIKSLSSGLRQGWPWHLLHFLPFILYNGVILYFHYAAASEVGIEQGFFQFRGLIPEWVRTGAGLPLALSGGSYASWSWYLLYQHQRALPNYYSYTEEVNLNWLRYLVISLILVFLILFILIRFRTETFIAMDQLFIVVGLVLTVYVFIVGFLGLRQIPVFVDFPEARPPVLTKEAYKHSGLDAKKSQQILQRLEQCMQEERPYLNENLSLAELARKIEVRPNQLSQVINQEMGVNFFTFVNRYRIETVKMHLKAPDRAHHTILAIAFDSGFRSKASFNKIFKELTGQTPSQYRKS
ncbi:MAG: helix-turn-helix transcriptional regulator [Bacteroidota bacterium]